MSAFKYVDPLFSPPQGDQQLYVVTLPKKDLARLEKLSPVEKLHWAIKGQHPVACDAYSGDVYYIAEVTSVGLSKMPSHIQKYNKNRIVIVRSGNLVYLSYRDGAADLLNTEKRMRNVGLEAEARNRVMSIRAAYGLET